MMKKLLFTLSALLFLTGVNAQSLERYVIGTLGGSWYDGSSFEMDFTVGEMAVTTLSNANNFLTQGFQQPFTNQTVSVQENSSDPMVATFYPNPVEDMLTIRLENTGTGRLTVLLYNMLGQQLSAPLSIDPTDGNASVQMDLSEFATGNYFIRVLRENELILTGKVVRINQ
jgi:hypothetical protein